jgi:hypothetical protein
MAVQGVVSGVELAADEPSGVPNLALAGLFIGLEPVKLVGPACREFIGVLGGLFPDLGVVDVGLLDEVF